MGIAIYAASAGSTLSLACIFCCRRFTSLQQTRLVSQDADHSRRSLCAPLCGEYSTILEGSLKLVSTLRPYGLRLAALQPSRLDASPRAQNPTPRAAILRARQGEAGEEIADLLTSEPEGRSALTSREAAC